jgi:hypothetical protein
MSPGVSTRYPSSRSNKTALLQPMAKREQF